MSMLLTEWNLDDALAVARKEGYEKGRTEVKLEIARNLLVEGSSLEFVHEITGLDIDTIKGLQAGL